VLCVEERLANHQGVRVLGGLFCLLDIHGRARAVS
jgi:hypothetical protein